MTDNSRWSPHDDGRFTPPSGPTGPPPGPPAPGTAPGSGWSGPSTGQQPSVPLPQPVTATPPPPTVPSQPPYPPSGTGPAAPKRSGSGSGSIIIIIAAVVVVAAIVAVAAFVIGGKKDDDQKAGDRTTVSAGSSTTDPDGGEGTTTTNPDAPVGGVEVTSDSGVSWQMPKKPETQSMDFPVPDGTTLPADLYVADMDDWSVMVITFDTEGRPFDLEGGLTGGIDGMNCGSTTSPVEDEIEGHTTFRAEVAACEDAMDAEGSVTIISTGTGPVLVMVLAVPGSEPEWTMDDVLATLTF